MKEKVIALGFFDGVHQGHGALLRKTIQRAGELGVRSAAFTFDRAPKEVVTGRPVPLISSPEDRSALMQRLYAIDEVIVAPFDQTMMTMDWQDFIKRLLVETHGAVHLVAGHDYHFGYKNQGTPELLAQTCAQLGLGCDIIPKVTIDGVTVSSTHIRELVHNGDLEEAAVFLGHPHTLTQIVRHGRRIGRTIGIPTVNLIAPPHVLVPGHGVYITRAFLPDGSSYAAVTNVGTRPTVNNGTDVTVEAFLVDFQGDLYGQTIRVDFYKKLRGEMKFDSLEDLKAQIARDTAATKVYFSNHQEG